jgi:hypothetical protein
VPLSIMHRSRPASLSLNAAAWSWFGLQQLTFAHDRSFPFGLHQVTPLAEFVDHDAVMFRVSLQEGVEISRLYEVTFIAKILMEDCKVGE